MKACERTVSEEGKTPPRIENPPTGLETQTKKETSSPRTEQLQIAKSKVHIGGKISFEEALRLEKWAVQDKYVVSATRCNNKSPPVGQYSGQIPDAVHESRRPKGPRWDARGVENSPNTNKKIMQHRAIFGPSALALGMFSITPHRFGTICVYIERY